MRQVNVLANQLNAATGKINSKVDEYNQSAGESFHKGEYNGKEINVYEFQDNNELKLALAHELGHALNLDHVSNENAIMYPVLKDQNLNDIQLTQEDVDALKVECKLK